MKIVSLNNPLSGVDYHRIKIPLTYLHSRKLIEGVESAGSLKDTFAQCDLLLYNRLPYGMTLDEVIAFRDKFGFKVCVDIDDYWNLYPGHILETYYKAHNIPRQVLQNIMAADVITTTTDRLYNLIKPFNQNVHVVPNGLPFDEGQFGPNMHSYYDQGNGIDPNGFIYCGGGSHEQDVNILRSSMRKLADEKFTGKIILAGVTDAPVYTKMSNVLSANGRILNFEKIQHESLDNYMSLYDWGEVAIAPLVDNVFNSCKSNLKILEAGAKHMPIIVSNTGPYKDDHCPFVMRANKPMDFCRYMKYCQDNKSFLADNAESLAEYVRYNYDVRNMNYLRLEAYNSVL